MDLSHFRHVPCHFERFLSHFWEIFVTLGKFGADFLFFFQVLIDKTCMSSVKSSSELTFTSIQESHLDLESFLSNFGHFSGNLDFFWIIFDIFNNFHVIADRLLSFSTNSKKFRTTLMPCWLIFEEWKKHGSVKSCNQICSLMTEL